MRKLAKLYKIFDMATPSTEPVLTPECQKLLTRATECFGNKDKALSWLRSPHAALGGKSPLELATHEGGHQAVLDELGRIEHGILA